MSSHWACRDRARRAHPTSRKPRTARPPAPRGLGLRELPLSRVVVRIRVTRGLHSSGPGRTVAHCATWPPPGGVPPCPARRARSRPLPLGQHTVSMYIHTHWACRDRARRAHPTSRKPRTARPPAPRGLGLRELPLSRVVVRIRVTRGLHSSGPGRTVAHCATWPPPGGVPPCPARRARSRPLPLGQHTVSMYIQTPGTRPRAALPRLRGRSNRAGPGEAAAEPDGGERAASGGLRRPPAATAAAAAVGSALPFPWSGGSSSGRPPPPPASSGSSDSPPPPLKQQQHHRTRRAPPPAGPA
jgi:hypothetical protein